MHRVENEKLEQNSIHKACEEIVQYYCCYHWCGLIPKRFHYLTQKKKKTRLTKSNFGEDSQVSCISKKYEKEEVEEKLPNEEIIQYYCCDCWCGLIPGPFHYLKKKKN